MGKFRFVLILMCVLALCIPSCTSHADNQEELETKISTGSRSATEISEWDRQHNEIVKHIKFETDTFFLDITLKQAKERGVSEEIYNMWLEHLKSYTTRARNAISEGGQFIFVNALTQTGNNTYPMRKDISATYNGTLVYPNFMQYEIQIPYPQSTFYKAVLCACNAVVYNTIKKKYVDCPRVEHSITLEGYNKYNDKVYNDMALIGVPAVDMPLIPFPGLLGDSVKAHTIKYSVVLAFPFKGDTIKEAWCEFAAMPF